MLGAAVFLALTIVMGFLGIVLPRYPLLFTLAGPVTTFNDRANAN